MRQKPFAYAVPRRPHAGLLRAAIVVLALSLGAPFVVKAADLPGVASSSVKTARAASA